MAPSPLSFKKTTAKATPTTDGDHRKRRRNRTTQSCLNCHTTKRMCDRKRPCSRCSQLGISGNCVYEVDDPNRQSQPDESRLVNRIAELEGVIRELKNKPHPRWLAEQGRPSPGSSVSHPSPPSSGGPSTPPIWGSPSPPRDIPGFPFLSQASARAPSFDNDTLDSLFSAYAGLTEHIYIRRGGTCRCLNEAACYNVVLELSLRLRKAADILAKSPSHSINSNCALHMQISELDALVKNVLLNVPRRSIGSPGQDHTMGPDKTPTSSNLFDQHYSIEPTFSWDFEDFSATNQDDLMSWTPTRGTM